MNLHVMDNERIPGIKKGRITTWNPTLILNVFTLMQKIWIPSKISSMS